MQCRFHIERAARVPILCAWDPCTNFHFLSVQPVGQNVDFHVFQIHRQWGRWFLSTNFPTFPQKNHQIPDKPWIFARHSLLHTIVNHPLHRKNLSQQPCFPKRTVSLDSEWMQCCFHIGRAARVPVLYAWDSCTNFHLLSVQPAGQNADFHVFQIRRRWGRWFLSTNVPTFPQKNHQIPDKPRIFARHLPLHTTVNHPPHLENRRKTEKFFCIIQKQKGKNLSQRPYFPKRTVL